METEKKSIEEEKTKKDLLDKDSEADSEDISMETLLQDQSSFSEKLYNREVVPVKVVHVSPEYVMVDIGEKKDGVIPVSDFQNAKKIPEPGDRVPVVLDRKGGESGHVLLSNAKARETMAWKEYDIAFKEKTRVKAVITGQVKGGYIIDAGGIEGFMPLSHSELRGAYKHHLPVNARIKCYIIELSRAKRKLVVSRKMVMEEDESIRRGKVLAEISPGAILRAVVSGVSPSGMTVRYHGLEGYVKVSDAAWRQPESAIKTYKRGQRIKAKLLAMDKETGKLDFGIKQLTPNPADILRRKYPPRSIVKASVISADEKGMLVSVSETVKGCIASSELGHLGPAKSGETVSAAVLGVNQTTFNLNLSVRIYEDIQDKKKIQQYLKGAPPLTLGQLLSGESEDASGGQ